MLQICITFFGWILFKINRTRGQTSFVLKLYFQTLTPNIAVRIMKKRIPWGKTTQQAADSLNSEKIWENVIRTVVIVRIFTHLINVVIDKERRHLEYITWLISHNYKVILINTMYMHTNNLSPSLHVFVGLKWIINTNWMNEWFCLIVNFNILDSLHLIWSKSPLISYI